MIAFPDTSFLLSLYFEQAHSRSARKHLDTLGGPLPLSGLLRFELCQSARLQSFLNSKDRHAGFTLLQVEAALSNFEIDISGKVFVLAACAWPEVFERADQISQRHTPARGHRSFDILHVATALHLGAKEFLTFDINQRKLARAEGLRVPL